MPSLKMDVVAGIGQPLSIDGLCSGQRSDQIFVMEYPRGQQGIGAVPDLHENHFADGAVIPLVCFALICFDNNPLLFFDNNSLSVARVYEEGDFVSRKMLDASSLLSVLRRCPDNHQITRREPYRQAD